MHKRGKKNESKNKYWLLINLIIKQYYKEEGKKKSRYIKAKFHMHCILYN